MPEPGGGGPGAVLGVIGFLVNAVGLFPALLGIEVFHQWWLTPGDFVSSLL